LLLVALLTVNSEVEKNIVEQFNRRDLNVKRDGTVHRELIDDYESNLIDIGVVMDCVPQRFQTFANRIQFSQKWHKTTQFNVIKYDCPGNIKFDIPSSISGIPIVSMSPKAEFTTFTRSTNVNMLLSMSRPDSIVTIMDIDMSIKEGFLVNVTKVVKPGIVYFPIVWSEYSPAAINIVKRTLGLKVIDYRNNNRFHGQWRQWGFGMYAMHEKDTKKFQLNIAYKGWGGEDGDLYSRVARMRGYKIVRENEENLIHIWHEKKCFEVVKDSKQLFSCLSSDSDNFASKFAYRLMLNQANKRRPAIAKKPSQPKKIVDPAKLPKVLIIVPTSIKSLKERVVAIMGTWGSDLIKNQQLHFFGGNSTEAVETAKQLNIPNYHSIKNVSDFEYPPVRKNAKMIIEASYLFGDNYDWIMEVDDDTHVSPSQLNDFLDIIGFANNELGFYGRRGVGRKIDRGHLGLEYFCMGGPGYLMSKTAVRMLAPKLNQCVERLSKSPDKKYIWHSDVILSKCMKEIVGIMCWQNKNSNTVPYDSDAFFQNYQWKLTDPDPNRITYHPLKAPTSMKRYHSKTLK
jgi:hypothetical protein